MDWTWKQNTCKSGIFQRFLCLFNARTTLLASHPSTPDIGGGSLGDDHTGANYVLFYMEGMPKSARVPVIITPTSWNARLLTISLMDTAGVVSEITLWSGVTTNFCLPKIARWSAALKSARQLSQEWFLEMIIDMRQNTTICDNRGKCPQCCHINLNTILSNDWVEWQVPLNFFNVYANN